MIRLNSKQLLCAAALAATSIAGCASSDGNAVPFDDQSEALPLQIAGGETVKATNPDKNGVHFAELSANGTGCPAGTWLGALSSDGLAFTITFSGFEVRVDPNKSFDQKTCNLFIKMHNPGGITYAVSEFYYSGVAFLEQGVTAEQTANYYFQGTRLNLQATNRTKLPNEGTTFDDMFVFEDKIETEDLVFAPCGVERLLNVRTSLSLRNGSTRREGYASLAAVDANTELKFRFAFRPCGDAGVGVVVAPDAGVTRTGR